MLSIYLYTYLMYLPMLREYYGMERVLLNGGRKKKIKMKRSLGLQGKDLDYGTPEGSMSLSVCLSVCHGQKNKIPHPCSYRLSISLGRLLSLGSYFYLLIRLFWTLILNFTGHCSLHE